MGWIRQLYKQWVKACEDTGDAQCESRGAVSECMTQDAIVSHAMKPEMFKTSSILQQDGSMHHSQTTVLT